MPKTKTSRNKLMGSRLRSAREMRRYTQAELANALNVTREYISKLEHGIAEVTPYYLTRFAKILAIREEYLSLESPYMTDEEFSKQWTDMKIKLERSVDDILSTFSRSFEKPSETNTTMDYYGDLHFNTFGLLDDMTWKIYSRKHGSFELTPEEAEELYSDIIQYAYFQFAQVAKRKIGQYAEDIEPTDLPF